MTGKSLARNMRNARTSAENIIIKSGVFREVVVSFCPWCGLVFDKNVQIQSTKTRFKCPGCHISIENIMQNRCRVCGTLCSDSETYNAHKYGGCPYAKTQYPGSLQFRGDNAVVKVE